MRLHYKLFTQALHASSEGEYFNSLKNDYIFPLSPLQLTRCTVNIYGLLTPSAAIPGQSREQSSEQSNQQHEENWGKAAGQKIPQTQIPLPLAIYRHCITFIIHQFHF